MADQDQNNLNNQSSQDQTTDQVKEVKTDKPLTSAEEVKTPEETVNEVPVQTVEETVIEPASENTEPVVTEETPNVEPPEIVEPEKTEDISDEESKPKEDKTEKKEETDEPVDDQTADETLVDDSGARWYVVHTYSGHENRVATTLKQRIESEGLTDKIIEILVPTQEKIEIKNGKKQTVKEKIFPGYILVKMILDDNSWLAIRTTQGVTSFVGALNKPTPIPESEVQTIVKFMQAGGQPTYKQVIAIGDTVKIVDGPFSDMIGKAEEVDKEKGKIKVLVSIFGRETPVELDFLQVNKL